jgi:hypothetical protein
VIQAQRHIYMERQMELFNRCFGGLLTRLKQTKRMLAFSRNVWRVRSSGDRSRFLIYDGALARFTDLRL